MASEEEASLELKCHWGHAGRIHAVLVCVSAGGLAVQGFYHLSSYCLRLYSYTVT